jgi:hypothetical protein
MTLLLRMSSKHMRSMELYVYPKAFNQAPRPVARN